ncbi:MAG: hypothetical protein GY917_20625 [Planctomycetaceae bacterium]|jgi:hypothetical protein|nr:hypothetical protein [Planctomycetaceae bacterium]MCP4816397.1 hypothetical protein [Planctomycetaceae bacterium]MEC9002969.1 hypothetical protein [Planctomycetota bacterium]
MNGLKIISQMKVWIRHMTEIGVFLVALSIVAEILFGEVVPFLNAGVIGNITAMISGLGEEGLVGLVALGIVAYVFSKSSEAPTS